MEHESVVISILKVESVTLVKLKRYAGVLLFDLPRFLLCIRPNWMFSGSHAWLKCRNRNENLISEDGHIGVSCDWKWTSDLVIANLFPLTGRWLMRRALSDFPILLREDLAKTAPDDRPNVSFLIGHRGVERLPLLLMTLKSIAGGRFIADANA